MNLDSLKDSAFDLIQNYPYLAALVVAVCLLIMVRKPKAFFKFALLLLVLAGFLYGVSIFSGVVSTGGKGSEQMRQKSSQQIEKDSSSKEAEPAY